jgi:5-methylcytosine-specific restriction enzyme A
MPNRPPRPCTRGCGQPAVEGSGLCQRHRNQQRANSDQRRPTSEQRGYGQRHRDTFRAGVFDLWGDRCLEDIGDRLCKRPASHADHYPHSRRELVALGHDPDDPQHGRPLCEYHHNRHTGKQQGRLSTKGTK